MKKEMKQPMQYLPQEFFLITVECAACHFIYYPPWLEKTDDPLIPIKPDQYEGRGRWLLQSYPTRCPNCNHVNQLTIPQKKLQSTYLLFGDEAYRETADKTILVYTLVGTNRNFIDSVNALIESLKRRFLPEVDPSTWTLHMKDIWPGDSRKKSVLKNLSFEEVRSAIDYFFELLSKPPHGMIVYTISTIVDKPPKVTDAFLKEQKKHLFSALVSRVVQETTDNGITPVFTFDAEKKGADQHIIHEWAASTFSGLQHSLLYAFLTGGIEIAKPIFVVPGSHAGLEMADLICYIVARYCYKRLKNEPVDLDPAKLGKIYYLGFERGGDFVYAYTEGYPWEMFH